MVIYEKGLRRYATVHEDEWPSKYLNCRYNFGRIRPV